MQPAFRLPDDLLDHLPAQENGIGIWVVGGAIRDHLLGRHYSDLDFVVSENAVELARTLANRLDWDFFVLDAERGAARILPRQSGQPIDRIDFSTIRGQDVEEDLKHRYFTINALAMNVYELSKLIDPTNGIQDLRSGVLRPCSPSSLKDDPVRVIRAVRFATQLEFKLDADAIAQVNAAVGGLSDVSAERIRDELFRILNGINVATAIRLLDHLHILEVLFPDIVGLKRAINGGTSTPTEWEIRLAQFRDMKQIVDILRRKHDPEAAADAVWGSLSLKLGRYREQISDFLDTSMTDARTRSSLCFFTLLGLPVEVDDEAAFDLDSAQIERGIEVQSLKDSLLKRSRAFRLSGEESEFIRRTAAGYLTLETIPDPDYLSDLELHRFYRDFGVGGVSAALLYLSRATAIAAGPPDADSWERRLTSVRLLWEAFFDRYGVVIEPPVLLNGSDLMEEFNLAPGPRIGMLLDALREAQVVGQVRTRQEAFDFIRELRLRGNSS